MFEWHLEDLKNIYLQASVQIIERDHNIPRIFYIYPLFPLRLIWVARHLCYIDLLVHVCTVTVNISQKTLRRYRVSLLNDTTICQKSLSKCDFIKRMTRHFLVLRAICFESRYCGCFFNNVWFNWFITFDNSHELFVCNCKNITSNSLTKMPRFLSI